HGVAALLLLGDNVYIDAPGSPLAQRYCYYRRQSQPEWRRLVAATSVAAIYDDHDFGTNDCVPGPDIEQPRWKRKVWRIFKQNWNNPGYGGGETRPGCWFEFHIGNVHFIMLDGRYYRDLKGGSMLGPVQKAWLLATLRTSPGVFKVLASDVPWSPGVKPGSQDTWDGFAAEREEIFSFIEKHQINGVILIAADRHRSDLRRIPRPRGYDLYEAMSSRLTNVHTHGLVKKAAGSEWVMGYNEKCSFGLLEFDTTAADPRVVYRIINIDNQEIGSRSLKLSELSCPAPTK
ncbi:alkaline phosphatase family protein, partial [bacterium]|nr:alkaline phosphatase family protein [bacterium]